MKIGNMEGEDGIVFLYQPMSWAVELVKEEGAEASKQALKNKKVEEDSMSILM